MGHYQLSLGLLSAETERERKKLLKQQHEIADVSLALSIKDLCYAEWTSDPTKAQKAYLALNTLQKFNPLPEIKAYCEWVAGIANITRGKLESAIDNLDGASGSFMSLGLEHLSAQPQVAKLIALAMLGKYDDALIAGDTALQIFDKYSDDLAAGKIEMNLSNIVARRELHLDSIKYCLSALKRFTELGEKRWVTMAQNDLARSYAQISDFREADRYFAMALKTATREKMTVTQAEIEASMGNLALFRGRYAEALRLLELSRRKYHELKMPHETAIAELEIADAYSEINLCEEACEIYAPVIESFSRLKMRREEAWARANFGRAAAALDKKTLARREFRKADHLFTAQKNFTARAFIKIDLASLELANGKFSRALALIEDALELLNENENLRSIMAAKWLKSEILRSLDRFSEAQDILIDLAKTATDRKQTHVLSAAYNSLGKLANLKGDLMLAKSFFKKAVVAIEKSRSTFAGDQFRRAFLGKGLEPFESLSRLHLSTGDVKGALGYIERVRSRALFDTIAENATKPLASTDSNVLVDQSLGLRGELNWLYKRQSNAPSDDAAGIQTKIYRIENELASISRRIEAAEGLNGKRRRTAPVKIVDIQRELGKGRVIVEYFRLDGTVSAFVIGERKIMSFLNLAVEGEVEVVLKSLRFQFDGMRYGANVPEILAQQLRTKINSCLQKLHEKLIRPMEREIKGKDVIFVPVGPLNYVPFHALFDGNKYLVESHEVRYAPSSSIWYLLSQKPERISKNALLIGFADDQIPMADEEIRSLGKIIKNSTSLRGTKASFASYIRSAPAFDILHLACHGQFRPENPMFSSLHLSDGWVTVNDICQQRLKARLVTLSACDTGVNHVYAGEELLGLARGFLSAGAEGLIVSLWKVNDNISREFMCDFYENLQNSQSIGASLRSAQIKLIRRSINPYYWSPFIFIGA